MAAFPAATAGAANLAASYAAVQASLRKQFYGDLVELRGALLNTMSLAPHRAATLHPKMNLIDSALLMLEESKPVATHAEMARLMNVSAKVARAVEAWRSRRPPCSASAAPLATSVAAAYTAGTAPAYPSPFAAPEVQAAAPPPPRAEPGLVPGGGGSLGPAVISMDRFDFLSRMISGAAAPASAPAADPLPNIDWDVPELKPSGNLDAWMPGEQAGAAAAAAAQQQQQAPGVEVAAAPPRRSSAEAFLAQFFASGSAAAAASQDAPATATLQSELHGQGGASPPLDAGAAGGLCRSGAPSAPAGLTSPRSVGTSAALGASSFGAQQAASSNDSGSGSAGSSRGRGGSSACASRSPGQLQQLPATALPHSGGSFRGSLDSSPFGSAMLPPLAPQPCSAQWRSGDGGTPFAGLQAAVLSGGGASYAPAPAAATSAGGFGFGNSGSLQLSQASHGAAGSAGTQPSGLSALQQLGLSEGSGLPPPHPASSAAYAAAYAQQRSGPPPSTLAAMQAGRLSVLQQWPHAALHAGSGGLAQLLGSGAGDAAAAYSQAYATAMQRQQQLYAAAAAASPPGYGPMQPLHHGAPHAAQPAAAWGAQPAASLGRLPSFDALPSPGTLLSPCGPLPSPGAAALPSPASQGAAGAVVSSGAAAPHGAPLPGGAAPGGLTITTGSQQGRASAAGANRHVLSDAYADGSAGAALAVGEASCGALASAKGSVKRKRA